MSDNRNLILAIVLAVIIMVGFQFVYDLIYPKPATPPRPVATQGETLPTSPAQPSDRFQPAPPEGVAPPQTAAAAAETRTQILATQPKVAITTPSLHGSISLIGARIDNITLVRYRETIDPKSPEIVLFSPSGAPDAYFAQHGWVNVGGSLELPGSETRWTADAEVLTPERPVTLTWRNDAGVLFKRTIAVDENYMFTIRQEVINPTGAAFSLSPYGLIARYGTPPVSGFFILHEGPLGVFNGTLQELDYDDLQKEGTISEKSQGGWIGITDKYWLSALVPEQQGTANFRFLFEMYQGKNRYQVDYVGAPVQVPAGGTALAETRMFVGAKVLSLLQDYQDRYQIPLFDRAIDFGWFWFLTRPIFQVLVWLNHLVGNFGVAILLLTVFVKLLFFPLANKSYKAMSQMRKLQPEMMRLKERFGDDRMRFNQEMMALYKREKVNPASGCMPILIQIPVFFALYKVLFVTIEMRHAPFFGWIHDLSAPDPTSVWNLFGLIPWDPAIIVPHILNIGAWPLIMGVTMYLQQKLNPQPPDPIQAKIFLLLPIVFTFMLATFPAGLVIYWAWNNLLSIAQQWVIMRRMGVKV
jgi:YidC/Oxa1 family membrane protein insertase